MFLRPSRLLRSLHPRAPLRPLAIQTRLLTTTPFGSTSQPAAAATPNSSSSSSSTTTTTSTAKTKELTGAPPLSRPEDLNDQEGAIWDLLAASLEPTSLVVRDVSGGCGSMYAIDVASPRFKGLGMLKQQRMVNAVLGERVKEWHGLQLRTKVA